MFLWISMLMLDRVAKVVIDVWISFCLSFLQSPVVNLVFISGIDDVHLGVYFVVVVDVGFLNVVLIVLVCC